MKSSDNDNVKAAKGSRWQGVLLIGFALVAGYVSIVMPLQQAYAGAHEISWTAQFAFLAPPLGLMGVLVLFFPGMTTDETFLLKAKDKLSVAGWIVVAALLLLGAGTYHLVDQKLSSLGYVDRQFHSDGQ
ncbi:MAG: hypothetical protein KGJ53_15490 [Alphaproteobacteria bacterium]|nr:hypothetical protein [Alphaproteobacteria bacterium]MDE2164565.1 hypothetical protein [Alphaproteobacteria bacterium]